MNIRSNITSYEYSNIISIWLACFILEVQCTSFQESRTIIVLSMLLPFSSGILLMLLMLRSVISGDHSAVLE